MAVVDSVGVRFGAAPKGFGETVMGMMSGKQNADHSPRKTLDDASVSMGRLGAMSWGPWTRFPLLAVLLALLSCSATRPVSRGRLPQQHPADIARIESEIEPSTEAFQASEADLLWDATFGYMRRVFPIERVSQGSRSIETPTLEWTEDERPHRTQISVSVVRGLLGEVNLKVVALDIAPATQLESIFSGKALDYTWELRGNLPQVEGIIIQQIKARHQMRLEGRSPELVPLVAPLPGLLGAKATPSAGGYLRPGASDGTQSK